MRCKAIGADVWGVLGSNPSQTRSENFKIVWEFKFPIWTEPVHDISHSAISSLSQYSKYYYYLPLLQCTTTTTTDSVLLPLPPPLPTTTTTTYHYYSVLLPLPQCTITTTTTTVYYYLYHYYSVLLPLPLPSLPLLLLILLLLLCIMFICYNLDPRWVSSASLVIVVWWSTTDSIQSHLGIPL